MSRIRNTVLVIAVHPDDETLGCGGTILKHKAEGDKIYWLLITNIHEINGFESKVVSKRQHEIKDVAAIYEFNDTFMLDFPTAQLDKIQTGEIINAISQIIAKIKPTVIYLPNSNDVHSDHRIAFQAAYSCTKNFRFPSIKRILVMETISETDFAPANSGKVFIPNYYVDITKYLEKKLAIFSIYESEIMSDPFPRSISSIKALARYRGSRIGKKYAEAFMLILEILD
jgi:N-acetylglucosamine malate deacetylase 1